MSIKTELENIHKRKTDIKEELKQLNEKETVLKSKKDVEDKDLLSLFTNKMSYTSYLKKVQKWNGGDGRGCNPMSEYEVYFIRLKVPKEIYLTKTQIDKIKKYIAVDLKDYPIENIQLVNEI